MMAAGAPAVPASPTPLAPRFGVRRRRFHMADFDIGHFGRHGHQIVGHGGVEILALFVVQAFLIERAADALNHAAANLLVDQHRIDHGAAIVHHPAFEQLDDSRVHVDLDMEGLEAVGEGEGKGLRHVVAGHHQFRLHALRQGVAAEIDDAAELAQGHAIGPVGGVDHGAVAQVQALRVGLQDDAGDLENVFAQRLARLQRRLAADPRRARRPGATAIGHHVGVAGHDADALQGHADGGRRDLGDDRVGSLALFGDADRTGDPACMVEPHGAASCELMKAPPTP